MNGLLEKFNEYKDISNYRIKYTLVNEDVIAFKLKQTDFPHLIGLHKLVDIPLIGQFNDVSNTTVSAKFLISKIKKESQLTESIIKSSVYFPNIERRYQNFSKDAQQKRYAESFFFNPTDIYIRKQTIVKVCKVEIYDKDGNLYLEDIV